MGELSNPQDKVVAVAALCQKRVDLVHEIGEAEAHVERLRTSLVQLDAVIRMFRADFNPDALPVRQRRQTKSPYFRHGELTQRILGALRDGGEVASSAIAEQAMRDKGLDPASDPATRADFVRRVGLQLNTLQRKGQIERLGTGRHLRYRLAERERI